jgi:hypothetical protein
MAPENTAPTSSTPAPTTQPASQQQTTTQTSAPKPAVDRIEARRQQITSNPDFWDATKGAELRKELAAITSGQKYTPTPADKKVPTTAERFKTAVDERAAAAKKAETERVAQLPQFEKRRLEITRALTDKNSRLTDQDRKAMTDELRRLVAGQMSAEEHETILNAPVGELREAIGFNLDKVLPGLRDQWDEHSESEVLAASSTPAPRPKPRARLWAGTSTRSTSTAATSATSTTTRLKVSSARWRRRPASRRRTSTPS